MNSLLWVSVLFFVVAGMFYPPAAWGIPAVVLAFIVMAFLGGDNV